MRPPKRTAAGITSVVLAVGVGAGLAQAAQKDSGTTTTSTGSTRTRGGPGPGAAAIASYLGLTAAQLRTQLEAGKTLVDVAKEQGKTVSGLEDVIVADAKTHLDAAVADGTLTAAQEATMLTDLKAHVDDFVTHVGPGPGGHGPGGAGHGGPFELTAVTDYLGLTAAELRTQFEAGKTLAEVASAQGKTVSGLENAIVAAATKKLDADVAAGRLTVAQETAMLADLKSHVDEMVNRTGPPAGGHRVGFGGPLPAAAATTTTNGAIFR